MDNSSGMRVIIMEMFMRMNKNGDWLIKWKKFQKWILKKWKELLGSSFLLNSCLEVLYNLKIIGNWTLGLPMMMILIMNLVLMQKLGTEVGHLQSSHRIVSNWSWNFWSDTKLVTLLSKLWYPKFWDQFRTIPRYWWPQWI